MTNITSNLAKIRKSIDAYAQEFGRKNHSIELLSVSKTKPVSDILLAYESKQRLFGENYVQEAVGKVQQLATCSDITWHFIGPLQSNKTKLVAENFAWVQSIDRLKIAKRLSEQRPTSLANLQVCVQININDEKNKAGVIIDEVDSFLEEVNQLPNIDLRGLMAIPMATDDYKVQLANFTLVQSIFERNKHKYMNFDTLSIGMSNDIKAAIACGSTMIRVGTAIFGARSR